MNNKLIFKIIGLIMLIEAALMILPLIIDFLYADGDWIWFLITILGSALIGAALYFFMKPESKKLFAREGFVVVASAWIVLSAIAAVPFVISGSVPNYLNALFETVSGFTTTGSTAIDDVEALSHSMLFWRSMTNWVGGMGILVFMLAISPVAGSGTAIHIMRAESPGPVTEKISPKISTTAKYLYLIYIIFTVAQIIALVIAKMPLFNSTLVAFATMATGGFSYLNTSMMAITYAQQTVTTVFMFLAGINFSLFFLVATGRALSALRDEEVRWYAIIFVVVTALTAWTTCANGSFSGAGEAIHHSAFMVASLVTTTGFASCDITIWPWFTKTLFLVVMFFGGCAGSTAGGIKTSRLVILFKAIKRDIRKMIHPRSVNAVQMNKKEVNTDVVNGVLFYFFMLIILTAASLLIVSFDPKADFLSAFSAVDTTINNNGIGFGAAGGSFSGFAWYSKVVFILDMLIGRLEIFPIIVFFTMLGSPIKKGFKTLKRKASHQ